MCVPIVRDYVPASWVALVQIKSLYYRGKSHQFVSEAMLWFTDYNETDLTITNDNHDDDLRLSKRAQEILQYLHKLPDENQENTIIEFSTPTNSKERTYLGKCLFQYITDKLLFTNKEGNKCMLTRMHLALMSLTYIFNERCHIK